MLAAVVRALPGFSWTRSRAAANIFGYGVVSSHRFRALWPAVLRNVLLDSRIPLGEWRAGRLCPETWVQRLETKIPLILKSN